MLMNDLYLSGIFIYPIKSLGGISLEHADVERNGLKYDRRWMLINEEGTFVSQRKYHSLALLNVHLDNETVHVTHRNDTSQAIDFAIGKHTGTPIDVTIWDDQTSAIEVDTKVSQWFSDFLGMNVRLVEMPQEENRYVDPRYAKNQETVAFADGYPCLIIGQSSLDGLNDLLQDRVKMDRFRPNFVFTGGEPHIEDSFACFTIGSVTFTAVKPCARCVLVTIDQQTGSKSPEPLKTLASYRTRNNKIMFGQNLLHSETGKLSKGDKLQVITTKPAI
jgi:uncharacterized protein YcbX